MMGISFLNRTVFRIGLITKNSPIRSTKKPSKIMYYWIRIFTVNFARMGAHEKRASPAFFFVIYQVIDLAHNYRYSLWL